MADEKTRQGRKKGVVLEDKPPEVQQRNIGAELRDAIDASKLRDSGRRSGRSDRSPLWNELNALSQFARNEYVSELKAAKDEKAQRKVEERYLRLASPGAMEDYLREESLPVLEAELEERKRTFRLGKIPSDEYEATKLKLLTSISLVSLDMKQLGAQRELDRLERRLAHGLGYAYLPVLLDTRAQPLLLELKNARISNREKLLEEFESLIGEFRVLANSPSKAKEYLIGARERDEAGLGLKRAEKPLLFEADLKKAEEHIAEAAPASKECRASGIRCRFSLDGFEAVSDATGSRIARLIHKDGSQVYFAESGETRVTSAVGMAAIYQNGNIVQRGDAEGNIIQYVDNARIRVMDSDGYMIIMDPEDARRFVVMDPEGGVVFNGKTHAERLENFQKIITKLEAEQVMETEEQRLSPGEMLARANKILPEAKKRLADIEEGHAQHAEEEVDIASCICSLSRQLRKKGILKFEGNPNGEGFDATLHMYTNNYDVTVLSATMRNMLRDAVRRNHPANAMSNPETTLAIEVPRMFFLNEEEKEHPIQYTRIFTEGLGNGNYVSIIALHKEMVKAIVENDFKVVGERIYDEVYNQMKDSGYSAVRWKLAWMPNSDVCQEIRAFYGEDFLAAMSEKDFNALGRQEVYDNLVHNVTHTLTRPNTRAHIDEQMKSLGITDEDQRRADIYVAMMFEGKETYPEQRDAVVKLHQEAYGTDLTADLPSLGVTIHELREEFFRNPTRDAYLAYQKADQLRDVLRGRYHAVNEFVRMAKEAGLGEYSKLSGEKAVKYQEECRESFKKILERELIENQGKAVDEGLAIAMQRSRYHTRAVPTSFSISIHLQGIAKEIGYEMLLNEVSGEVSPWDLVRRANQLRDISHGYNDWPFIANKAKTARIEEVKKLIDEIIEYAQKGIALGKAATGAG